MKNVEDVYALTPVQQGMLFHSLYEPDSGVYVEHLSWTIRGELNIPAFGQAWQRVVDVHPILRTAFFVEGLDEPLQVVRHSVRVLLKHLDWRGLSSAEHERRLKGFIAEDRVRGVDLTKAPLIRLTVIRLSDDGCKIIWTHHHILLDGWSTSLVLRDVFQLYQAFSEGRDTLPERAQPFSQYVAWVKEQDRPQAEKFWRVLLKGVEQPTGFRPDHRAVETAAGEKGPDSREIHLPERASSALKAIARQNQLTLNTLVQGAWSFLLSCYSGQRDVVFGSIVSSRPSEIIGVESMVGLFVNALPARVEVQPEAYLIQWLNRIQNQQANARQYEYCALADIQGWSDVPKGQPLFDNTLAFENFPLDDVLRLQAGSSLQITDLVRYGSLSNYPINVVVEPSRELLLQIGYDLRLFDTETILRILGHYRNVLERMASDPKCRLFEISLLTPAERQQLIVGWNSTKTNESQYAVHVLFENQTVLAPDAIVLEFEDESISYRELNVRANKLAHYLKRLGIGPGDRIALFPERSLEAITGLIAILKSGGAYLPLDPGYPPDRLAFMLEDAQVSVILTQGDLIDELPSSWALSVCIDSDWGSISIEDEANPSDSAPLDRIAYVIYTSGSTGNPKGVLIRHEGVCNLARAQIRVFQVMPESRVLQFASLSFDASVSEIFTALSSGATLILAKRDSLLPGPGLMALLREKCITVVTLPPSVLAALPDGEFPALRTLVVAGEACSGEVVSRWARGRRFLNAYGPSEATVCLSYSECGDRTGTPPIGRPLDNTQVFIVDSNLQPVPIGVPGEIHACGIGLSDGYLNRPDLTAQAFVPNQLSGEPGSRLYRTGDVARYLSNGEIEFLGRLDNQVKVRGYRIELAEIEEKLRGHPAIRDATVIALEGELKNRTLTAYIVPKDGIRPGVKELRGFLEQTLPDYMIPQTFVALDALPLTPSGKVDRSALSAFGKSRLPVEEVYAAPRNTAEEVLALIWADVLGLERVGIDDSFFALGGDSILSLEILSRAQERGWDFTLPQLFQAQTIRALAQQIREPPPPLEAGARTAEFSLISNEDRAKLANTVEDAYPLTKLQQGMIFHSQSRPDTAIYHSIISIHLRAPLDAEALEAAIQRMVNRHAQLRVSLDMVNFSQPIQLVHRAVGVQVEIEDLRDLGEAEQRLRLADWLESEKRRHFDWARPPLFRITVHRLTERTFQFTMTAHHSILDGWSDMLLLTELSKLYEAYLTKEEIALDPPPATSFRDYVVTEREILGSEEARSFWHRMLDGSTVTRLPRLPQEVQAGINQFGVIERMIPIELAKNIVGLARRLAVPIKCILLAAHLRVLNVIMGQNDVLTGVVSSARPESADADRVVGLFLNTLPFRIGLHGGSWVALIEQVFEAEKEMLPYRQYPLAQIQINHGSQPLFETCFNFTHFHLFLNSSVPGKGEVLGSTSVTQTEIAYLVHFGLDTFTSQLYLSIDYDARELSERQIETDCDYLVRTLEAIVRSPDDRYETLSPLSENERNRILFEWNETEKQTSAEEWVSSLLESQAARIPDAVAASHKDHSVTYRELNRRANQLAHYLQKQAIGPDLLVGFCVERSIEMLVGLLGIWKAGAAYVPLAPNYPQPRLAYMLEDSAAAVLLTQQSLDLLPEPKMRVVRIDSDWELIAAESEEEPPLVGTPDNLAYVIYTSGSTGQPKGVMIPRRTVVNFLRSMQEQPGMTEHDVLAAVTPLSFDIAGLELYLPLISGARVVLIGGDTASDGARLAEALLQSGATVMQATPAGWRLLLETGWPDAITLRVLCGGEALTQDLARNLMEKGEELWNLYGPTETTVWSAIDGITSTDRLIAIGRPIANTRLYILNGHLQPIPVGAPGDLYIGGTGLARGYLGQAAMTAERFIPDPYVAETGVRMYCTGDLARYDFEGKTEFLGRLDHQVKVRGFRVELGEIEEQLTQYAGVREGVMLARQDSSGESKLVAYIVPGVEPAPTLSDLRALLRKTLPDYMLPSAMVVLDTLPLTPNGKIDRRALESADLSELAQQESFVPARTPVEQAVATMWSQVLGIDQVSVESNFFELGGHSLLVARVISMVRDAFDVEVDVASLIEEPTVAGLARYVQTVIGSEEEGQALSV